MSDHMKLRDWMEWQKLSQNEVARRLGISQGHVNDLVQGRFWPSRNIAVKIWKLTEGKVTPTDFLTPEERDEISA